MPYEPALAYQAVQESGAVQLLLAAGGKHIIIPEAALYLGEWFVQLPASTGQ